MIRSNKERVCGTRSSLRAGQGAKNEIEDFLNAVPAPGVESKSNPD